MKELTPRKIVKELDKYIVGQTQAKNQLPSPSGIGGVVNRLKNPYGMK